MFHFYLRGKSRKGPGGHVLGSSSIKGSGEVIRAPASYTSGWGSFVLLKMDCIRVARGGSLSTLHRVWDRNLGQDQWVLIYYAEMFIRNLIVLHETSL